MPAFTPGQPANVVHSSLKSASETMEAAKQNAILWFGEMVERKLFRDLGYSTIHHYAAQELGYAHALEVVKVTDKSNQDQWLGVSFLDS